MPRNGRAALVRREGSPSGHRDNDQSEVISVWLEGIQLVEFTTPELLPAYLRTFGPDGVPGLDALLRAQEAHLRQVIARTR